MYHTLGLVVKQRVVADFDLFGQRCAPALTNRLNCWWVKLTASSPLEIMAATTSKLNGMTICQTSRRCSSKRLAIVIIRDNEAVAHAVNRLNIDRVAQVRLDLPAQTANLGINGAVVIEGDIVIHRNHQLLSGQNVARMAHEHFKNSELRPAQVDIFIINPTAVSIVIQRQCAFG